MIAASIISGHITWFIIALTVLEVAALAAYRRLSFADYLPNILAGDFLLLAWVFSAAHWAVSAVCLLGALLAHATDLLRRIISGRKSRTSRPG